MTKEQWEAIRDKNPAYDGRFFYGVKTTKIVCRPSCRSKICRPCNVVIYDTLEEALADGYRPCLRCRPDRPDWKGARTELAQAAHRLIEQESAHHFSLRELAERLYVSEEYLSRTFREVYGDTPLHYHHYCRCEKAKELLVENRKTITEIAGAVGYMTSSHFAGVFRRLNGVTPSEFRRNYWAGLEGDRD